MVKREIKEIRRNQVEGKRTMESEEKKGKHGKGESNKHLANKQM